MCFKVFVIFSFQVAKGKRVKSDVRLMEGKRERKVNEDARVTLENEDLLGNVNITPRLTPLLVRAHRAQNSLNGQLNGKQHYLRHILREAGLLPSILVKGGIQ